MKTFFISLFLITLISYSCPDSSAPSVKLPQPKRLFPRDSFVLFITDVHVAETFISEIGRQQKSNTTSESKKVYSLLFKKYHLSQKQAQENMTYYSSDAKEIESIYKDVLKHLHDWQLGIDSLKRK